MQEERPLLQGNTTQTLTSSSEKRTSLFQIRTRKQRTMREVIRCVLPCPEKKPGARASESVLSQNRLFLQTDSSAHTGSAGTNSFGASRLETVMSPRALPLFPKRPFTPRRTSVPFREAWPLPSRPRMGGQRLSCRRQCYWPWLCSQAEPEKHRSPEVMM